VIKQPH